MFEMRATGSVRRTVVLLAGFGLVLATFAAPTQALAQSVVCDQGKKLFAQRQSLIEQINSWSKKKVDPGVACSTFGKLQTNGAETIKFVETNKDWCQIPEQFLTSLKDQQKAIVSNRGQACKVAAQMNQQRNQAQAAAAAARDNPFAGPDQVTGGPLRVPGGAL